MKNKLLMYILVCSFCVFILSYITAGEELDLSKRLICALVLGSVGGVYFYCGPFKTGYSKTKKSVKYIYYGLFEHKIAYRIEGNKIYKGLDGGFTYTIKDNKIYEGIGGIPKYRIEKNRIYRTSDTLPLYRIEGNRIYKGVFGREVVYRITDKTGG